MNSLSKSIQSLDPVFKKIEGLDKIQRLLICAASFLLITGGVVYFSFLPGYNEINLQRQSYQSMQGRLRIAKSKAAKLPALKKEWKDKEAEFRKVMKALPEKREIPSLLTSISQSGQDTGLEFLLFQPGSEQDRDFYGEIPVEIKINGNFHNVVMFFDKVTGLNRIVNIKDIEMKSSTGGKLATSCTALTYKFVEEKKAGGKKK